MSSALLAEGGPWPLTFELYLPQSWMTDPDRRREAGIPDRVVFREKWRIALAHIRTVLDAGFQLDGVTVDADYGSNRAFRTALERLGLRYGVAIRGDLVMATAEARRTSPASVLAEAIPAAEWQTITWGTGTKGPLTADFRALRVRPTQSRGERWLLCERSRTDGARKYYLLNLAPTASLRDLVALARSRWPIEQQYRELKDELGVDHFEGRTFRGWMHHTVLTAVAFTFLQLERARGAGDAPRPTLPTVRFWVREIMGLLYVINSRRLMHMMISFQHNPPLRR